MKIHTIKNKIIEADKRYQALEDILIIQARSAVIGEMLSMIAHQWRQPLSIMGMVSSKMRLEALSSAADNQEILSDLAVMDKNISYLSNTIEDFKNFFEPNVRKEWLNGSKVCTQLRALACPVLKFHNIELEIILNDTKEFFVYPSELNQVLLSLVANAKDAINEHHTKSGKIIILCEEIADKEEYRISVSDNGGGISNSIIESLFEPYISTKEKDGTGLGLYMAKTIIEKHFNGTVSAKNIDEGACFTLQFPIELPEVI
ncbi:MAG: HAMP domain-containing sensor histidine kinase [Sulfurimonadaceae bacterium]|jgi:signal transduction histidine kinase|nr:HAMP domain-containing sensor histidine kinase [Sulfurimonadaceae bacterium]